MKGATTAVFSTCSFPEYRPEMGGTPVRIANGSPRYKLKYSLTLALPGLFPDRSTLKWPRDKFTEKYVSKLEEQGVEGIRQAAAMLRSQAGLAADASLVLLCFEQLAKPTRGVFPWCHRSIFAGWWTSKTGEAVPELGAVPMAETRAQEIELEQPGLF